MFRLGARHAETAVWTPLTAPPEVAARRANGLPHARRPPLGPPTPATTSSPAELAGVTRPVGEAASSPRVAPTPSTEIERLGRRETVSYVGATGRDVGRPPPSVVVIRAARSERARESLLCPRRARLGSRPLDSVCYIIQEK